MDSCWNCDGRKCMSCVFREEHDYCLDDCPHCCGYTAKIAVEVEFELASYDVQVLDDLRQKVLTAMSDAFPEAESARLLRPFTADGWS